MPICVRQLLATVGRGQGDKYPHELSGASSSVWSLARALAPGRNRILLDEPFSNSTSVCANACRSKCARS